MDEPTAGLDPNQIREVRALVKDLGSDRTVLLSTHILSEVEATCERAIVIDRGRLVAEGTIEELRARQKSGGLSLRIRDPNGLAEAAIAAISGANISSASSVEGAPDRRDLQISLRAEKGREATIERLVQALTQAGIGIHALVPEQASLEQVFSELTQHDADAAITAEGTP